MCVQSITVYNKLAKARKMHKPPDTLGLKKFEPGKLWVANVSTHNSCIFAFLHTFVLITRNPTKNIFIIFSLNWTILRK